MIPVGKFSNFQRLEPSKVWPQHPSGPYLRSAGRNDWIRLAYLHTGCFLWSENGKRRNPVKRHLWQQMAPLVVSLIGRNRLFWVYLVDEALLERKWGCLWFWRHRGSHSWNEGNWVPVPSGVKHPLRSNSAPNIFHCSNRSKFPRTVPGPINFQFLNSLNYFFKNFNNLLRYLYAPWTFKWRHFTRFWCFSWSTRW